MIRKRWAALAQGRFDYTMIPDSTHQTLLLHEPLTQILAAHLAQHLATALTDPLSAVTAATNAAPQAAISDGNQAALPAPIATSR